MTAKGAAAGLTDSVIADTLRTAVAVSQVAVDVAQHDVAQHDVAQHDVVLRASATAPTGLADGRALPMPTAAGPVRLRDVATVRKVEAPTQYCSR
ncbi:hypothetical protein GCM10022223_66630 [Kineosporia mesophila]|uniref:Uncharacterized protein n=1 Tax=Kineosporia mesophila TaxID=566012 RepID=A0ABP7ARQ3_9ACTN|nr:hypothetical protein [Kineosporia mesophila]MCD5349093.1 hypothetical protein [Kineosporia mesophila]